MKASGEGLEERAAERGLRSCGISLSGLLAEVGEIGHLHSTHGLLPDRQAGWRIRFRHAPGNV